MLGGSAHRYVYSHLCQATLHTYALFTATFMLPFCESFDSFNTFPTLQLTRPIVSDSLTGQTALAVIPMGNDSSNK